MPKEDTQFKPGQSGNPNGRPKKAACLTDILRGQGNIEDVKLEDGTKISRKEAIARKMWSMALGGDPVIMKYLYDRIDGKPKATVDMKVEQDNPIYDMLKEIMEGDPDAEV